MGFEEDRFVGSIDAERKCALCRCVLDNPLVAPCGRRFCSGCVLPPVVQSGKCPLSDCSTCSQLTPGDLHNMLDLRTTILNMQVKCDYVSRGCKAVVILADLAGHVADCEHRPVKCRNRGCIEVHDRRDLAKHEAETCEYRPVGTCQQGCGLVLVYKEASGHKCLEALKSHIANQELGITGMESEMKRLASKFSKREKSLLAQVASLHSEIQMQALRFQKKLNDYRSKIAYVSKKAAQTKAEEIEVTVVLERGKGSLGFNIMGGYLPDSTLTDGIVVSRITDGGVAERAGMKLHDQIIQVNGQDLSQSSHEEAVEAFRTAKEPIVVEVLRRVSKPSKMKSQTAPSPPMVSTATQTDDYLDDMPYYGLYSDGDPETEFYAFNGNGSLMSPASRQAVAFSPSVDLGLTDIEMVNGLDYDEQFDDERAFEMEYEEVTLTRNSLLEKVGLTLCYGSAEDDITDIFISEIEPHGVAGRSGRIHEGDQILQINGVDVHSREQAIRLFAENRSDITLLLARPQLMQMDDGFMDEQNLLDDIPMEMLDQHARCGADYSPNILAQGNDEEGGTTDTATTENSSHKQEKDSGVGRTDDSTRNDESSEQEIMENECTSPSSTSKFPGACKLGSEELHFSNDSFTSNEAHDHDLHPTNEISAEQCKKFREVLETRCSSVENSPRRTTTTTTTTTNGVSGGGLNGGDSGGVNGESGTELPRKDSQSSIEREIAMLNKEMEMIQLECQEIVEAHARERQRISTDGGGGGGGGVSGGVGVSSTGGVSGGGTTITTTTTTSTTPGGVAVRSEPYRSPRMVPRMGTKMDYMKQVLAAQEGGEPVWVRHEHLSPLAKEALKLKGKRFAMEELKDKDTSTTSAYNTGDSCRSTPLTLELNAGSDGLAKNSLLSLTNPKPSHSDSEKMTQTQSQTLPKKEWNSDGDAKKKLAKSTSSGSVSEKMSQTQIGLTEERMESLQDLYAQYADVMYTNRANLEHTIMVQQKLFQQQLLQRTHASGLQAADKSAEACGLGAVSNPVLPGSSGSSHQMEWVVKRRADGSRYITRRPVRNKILKERGKKIAEERCGMTTDDDAVSEMKVGRYWTREDRKRHLEKARDHKKRKELMIKQRMETLKEIEGEGKKEPNIVELSHRKMMRHKGKKVFDDFTTVQEMLAHGSREHQGKTYNPLLSVTTV